MAEQLPKPDIPKPEAPEPAQPLRHVSHSYQDDLAQAMNATDAPVVQELLYEAKEREETARIAKKIKQGRKWYTSISFIFLLLALAIISYGIYTYTHFTVPVVQKISVGVFPTTDPIVASDNSIETTIEKLTTTTTLKENTPYLVPIVTDATTGNLVSNHDLFAFMKADVTEPFENVFDSVRLGVMNTGETIIPFIIGSVADPVITTKEFLIAEPDLLHLFYRALNINLDTIPSEIGTTYVQAYRYNLPVRVLSYSKQDGTKQEVFLYGFANDHIVVITTDASILKSVADQIIRQQ